MRILQIITLSELGGAQGVVINLVNNLIKEHQIIVAAGGDGAMWTQLDVRVKKIKIESLQRAVNPIKDIATIFVLRKIYKKYKPDIIHLHSSKAGILGRIAFPKSRIIYTVHGFDSIRVAYRKFLPIEKLLKYKCKAIVAVSTYDKNNLIREGISQNIYTIYNGIVSHEEDSNNTTILPIDVTKKTIITIARTDPPKRFDLFIQIAFLLPQYNFVWIGNRDISVKLPFNMICMGEIPQAARFYKLADLCLLISDYEGLPMTIIEAMSYGKPIVASNVGGISEIVINGSTGFVVENEKNYFIEKITNILEDKDMYDKFSINARVFFLKNLEVERMASQYFKLYSL